MFKKILTIIFLLWTSSISAVGAAEKPVLKIIDNDWVPYGFAGRASDPKGLIKDVIDICAPKLGYDTDYKYYPIKRMYRKIKDGSLDLMFPSYKKKREEMVYYSKEPIFREGYRPIVLAGRDIEINAIQDFDTLKLGHLSGLVYTKDFFDYVKKREKEGTLVIFPSFNSQLKMLLSQKIDVIVNSRNSLLYKVKEMGYEGKVKALDFDIKTADYYIALSKKSKTVKGPQAFLDAMDACVIELKQDGTYNKILAQYGL